MAAARAWATGRAPGQGIVTDRAGVAEDLEFFGAPPEIVAQYREGKSHDEVEVHHDNVQAFVLFDGLGSQWRTQTISGKGGTVMMRTGLDYGAVEMAARVMDIDLDAENFARLRILESAALEAWGEEMTRSLKA
ncbi:MAG: DUF1799 domain-containing protein [Alphaproteobacteria bacterium]